jgi:hypothetical protein
VIKYKKLRGARYMPCMGEMRKAFNGLIEKSEGKRPLGNVEYTARKYLNPLTPNDL